MIFNIKYDFFELFGILGLIFSNVQWLPHLYKLIKTNDTKTFSLTSYLCLFIAYIFFFIYSLSLESPVFGISIIIKFLCTVFTLFYIISNLFK